MQQETRDMIIEEPVGHYSMVAGILARQFEKMRLQHRAEKYRIKEDRGGIAYIRRAVKKGDTVFDIGAHKAGYLYFFLDQQKGMGKIYAFEPQSVLYAYLLKLQQLFSWQNVVIEPLAVSSAPGKAILNIPYNNGRHTSPCATIIENGVFPEYQSQEVVTTVSLDEYCFEAGILPDFLKVDVEGNELSVFKGAENILKRYKPKILFECEARFVGREKVFATFDLLQTLGYRGYFIMDDVLRPIAEFNPLYHQDLTEHIYCNNFIFE
jgi:FkbM family methyltransferase